MNRGYRRTTFDSPVFSYSSKEAFDQYFGTTPVTQLTSTTATSSIAPTPLVEVRETLKEKVENAAISTPPKKPQPRRNRGVSSIAQAKIDAQRVANKQAKIENNKDICEENNC